MLAEADLIPETLQPLPLRFEIFRRYFEAQVVQSPLFAIARKAGVSAGNGTSTICWGQLMAGWPA